MFFFYFLLLVELEVLLCTHAHTSGGFFSFFFLFFSLHVEALGSISACQAEYNELVCLSLTSLFLQTCRWTFFRFLLFSRV